jgi:flagellar biosynthesis/type III secretory pathway protein FliH
LWQRRCRRCFRALKEREEAEARQEAYDAGLDRAYDAGWDSGYRSGLLSVLNEGLLHDLIQLCHPDRHSGRVDLATRVTRQLLELREQTRRAA